MSSVRRSLTPVPGANILRRSMASVPVTYGTRYGPGGRNSNAGMTVTVFGSYGFLGRYVVSAFASKGTRVYIPYRGCEMEVRHLRPMFDHGQCGYMPFSPKDDASVLAAVQKSDVVINLIGKFYETKHIVPTRRDNGKLSRVNYSYEQVNVDVAAKIARISKEAGVKRLIHVSALAADEASPSVWAQTKAKGEKAVREAFPEAIIVRPGKLFGYEDRFLNWYAGLAGQFKMMLLINGGQALVQPTYSLDVAQAIYKIATEKGMDGKTFALAGAEEYTLKEISEFVTDVTSLSPYVIDVPLGVAEFVGRIADNFPWPFLNPDEARLMSIDNVLPADLAAEGLFGYQDLDITPTPMERAAFAYLHRFRPGGHFTIVSGYH